MMNSRIITYVIRTPFIGSIILLTAGVLMMFQTSYASADDSSNYCPKGGSWIFVSGVTPPTVTYIAPEGMEITEYCVGDGLTPPKFVDIYPYTATLTVNVPAGRRAHASFQVQPITGYGCMNTDAFNYDPSATVNGGCIAKCQWNEVISEFDVSCQAPSIIYGCTDPLANNFDPQATVDDQNCAYETIGDDNQMIDPLLPPNSTIRTSEELIPITGVSVPSSVHLYVFIVTGLLGLVLLGKGLHNRIRN